jgi:peptidoglycan/LPS O-acetylase OafA/YrhL
VWAAAGALIAYAICAYLYGRSASEAPGAAIGGTVARSSPELVVAYSLSRAALLAAIALAPFWLRAPFDNAPVRKVAELSYGIYLIHLVVCAYVCSALLGLPTDGSLKAVTSWFGVAVAVSVAYAYVSLRYVEAPFRRRARRQIKERQQAQGGVPEPSGSGRAAPAHPARS